MKTLNNTTKAAARFIYSYNNSRRDSLRDCYASYSTEKARAERACLEMMRKENGHGFKIISFNCNFFSCGWETAAGLRIETPCNSFLIA